jgi:hypothetical protein
MLFKRITGIYGEVTIPSIGLHIATMGDWTLSRREETTPELGEWDLRAVFSYVNEYAFRSEDWKKEIRITIGDKRKGKQYRLDPTTGRTVLEGRSLLIEGVNLCPLDRS